MGRGLAMTDKQAKNKAYNSAHNRMTNPHIESIYRSVYLLLISKILEEKQL